MIGFFRQDKRSGQPTLAVTAGMTQIPVLLRSLDWYEGNTHGSTDTPGWRELLRVKKVVPPETVVRLSFDPRPIPFSVTVTEWGPGAPKPVPFTDVHTFVLPTAPGVYVYLVDAQWPNGKASYVFQVEVR
jgi:hypothetical protein